MGSVFQIICASQRDIYHQPNRCGTTIDATFGVQQAEYLRNSEQIKAGVKHFVGDMGLDAWGPERWKREFQCCQIAVCTPQAMLNLLRTAFLKVYLPSYEELIPHPCLVAVSSQQINKLSVLEM